MLWLFVFAAVPRPPRTTCLFRVDIAEGTEHKQQQQPVPEFTLLALNRAVTQIA